MKFAKEMLASIKNRLEQQAKAIAVALEEVKTNPAYTFEWKGDDLALSNITGSFNDTIAKMEKENSEPDVIVTVIMRQCMRIVMGRSLMSSTNMLANAYGVYERDFCLKLMDAAGYDCFAVVEKVFPPIPAKKA